MDWIYYSIINVAKYIVTVFTILLALLTIPLIILIFSHGIILSHLRDIQHHNVPAKPLLQSLPEVKLEEFMIWPLRQLHIQSQVLRVQQSKLNQTK